jgi:steroid 5-alpha reductase family enzyme
MSLFTPGYSNQDTSNIFVDAAIGTIGFQLIGFVAATILQTEVFYDCFGGLNFLGIAIVATSYYVNLSTTTITATVTSIVFPSFTLLFMISRGWLLLFLVWRAHKRKGDSRFDEVIGNPPLFFIYWMVQASWVYLISMPLLVLTAASATSTLSSVSDAPLSLSSSSSVTITDTILLLGFAGSIVLQITSDIQKTHWIEQGRIGTFCQVGCWKFSRHPNYAGEVLQWWFAAILAIHVSGDRSGGVPSSSTPQLFALLSPIFTMHILLNISGTGIWNAEGRNQKRFYESNNRNEYINYRQRTSPLIPFPPSWYKNLPMNVKRFVFFEWERYEYAEPSSVDNYQKKVS